MVLSVAVDIHARVLLKKTLNYSNIDSLGSHNRSLMGFLSQHKVLGHVYTYQRKGHSTVDRLVKLVEILVALHYSMIA